jgi:hypothetical protein
MAFGVLSYSGTDNLGDEIQSLAAMGHIPEPKYFLDRDKLDVEGDKIDGYASVIMNGWYGQFPEHWPPSDKIRPLLVSMHITKEKVSSKVDVRPNEFMLSPSLVKYMHMHGPVGARDLTTLNLLQEAGVDSYFSGCMTLTLKRPDVSRLDDLVVFCDVPQEALKHARAQARKPVFSTSHIGFPGGNQEERFHRARELLSLYARASCVVTARLHCALPCLAMGTPVLFINVASDAYRFAGLLDFLHHGTAADYISGKLNYDINNPPENKTDHLFYRQNLISRVKRFVEGDADFVWQKNALHPTQADRDEAIRLIHYNRMAPGTFKAVQATYLKKQGKPSSELGDNEKIFIEPGSLVECSGTEPKAGHVFLKDPSLNGIALKNGPWCIYSGHWKKFTP